MIYNLRRNDERSNIAIVVLWLIIISCLASIISSYLQYNLLTKINEGANYTDSELDSNDLREQIIAIVRIILMIISAITFIQWFRRAYYNLCQMIPNSMEFTEGWAAGAWFVPFLNLFRPVQMMRETYTKTEIILKRNNISLNTELNDNLISWWWAFWIISEIVNRILSRLLDNQSTIQDYIDYSLANIGSELLTAIAALFAIQVIKNYSKNEPLLRKIESTDNVSIY